MGINLQKVDREVIELSTEGDYEDDKSAEDIHPDISLTVIQDKSADLSETPAIEKKEVDDFQNESKAS